MTSRVNKVEIRIFDPHTRETSFKMSGHPEKITQAAIAELASMGNADIASRAMNKAIELINGEGLGLSFLGFKVNEHRVRLEATGFAAA